VCFDEREVVNEFGGGAVEGNAGEVAYRWDLGAERSADLAFESVVELRVTDEAEVDGEVLADEKSSDGADYAGLC
jgi:hypothetical protein